MRTSGPILLLLLAGASVASSPAAPPAATRAADTGEFLVYEAADGDTLQDLARDHFLQPDDWRKALALNRLAVPELPAGTRVRLDRGWLKREPLSAELVAFRGAVSVRSGKEDRPATAGMRVAEGDRIATGIEGFATLRFPDGSLVSLPTNSAMRLDRLRRYPLADGIDRRLTLEQGTAESTVVPLVGAASRYEVTTPVAVSAVRGTQFRVHFTPGTARALTEVVEGVVGVTPRGTGAERRVPAGYGIVVGRAGTAGAQALPIPPVALAMPALQSGARVTFGVRPQPGIVAYRVEVATDRDFVDRVATATSADGRFNLGGLPAGRLHARIVAIGANGLVGLPAVFHFDRTVSIPVGPATAQAADADEATAGDSEAAEAETETETIPATAALATVEGTSGLQSLAASLASTAEATPSPFVEDRDAEGASSEEAAIEEGDTSEGAASEDGLVVVASTAATWSSHALGGDGFPRPEPMLPDLGGGGGGGGVPRDFAPLLPFPAPEPPRPTPPDLPIFGFHPPLDLLPIELPPPDLGDTGVVGPASPSHPAVVAPGAAPEPALWMQLILGFGFIGFAARRAGRLPRGSRL